MALTTGIGGLVWKVLRGDGLPIETLLTSADELLVILWGPGLGCMAVRGQGL